MYNSMEYNKFVSQSCQHEPNSLYGGYKMNDGFLKTVCATPEITVANCMKNAEEMLRLLRISESRKASVAVFPELCITGYTCGDLFLQPLLQKNALRALSFLLEQTSSMPIVFTAGLPIPFGNALYNCAAVCCGGKILGVVPKTNVPNYGEFYEKRHFTGGGISGKTLDLCGQKDIPFGNDLIFECSNMPEFKLGVEICEDLWVADSPSQELACAGASVIANPSASNETIAKAAYRLNLVSVQSGKLCCAYLYADCGFGESTTDLIFSGHNIIAENGSVLAQSKRFSDGLICTDIDLERICTERRRINNFENCRTRKFRRCRFDLEIKPAALDRKIERFPFVPSDEKERNERSLEILTMQASGLAVRLKHTGIKNVVLGLSGGLDSTLALIVCAKAFDMLGIDRKNIHTVTMPCFGTTVRTRSNAELLAEAYGTDFEEVNISAAVRQHFSDIGHDESVRNVTYENSQARERTQVLMDIANKYNALVIGTGDLSELALGWATYNGDHMSMYGVNASIPKTLVRYLAAYEASSSGGKTGEVLRDILDTPVSPELLPPAEDGKISQITEDVVGPYELHDFFLYHFLRYACPPKKLLRLALHAFDGKYDRETVLKWLKTFIRRFFTQQFKRSCLPDGPKVGSVTLSPRGDWRMPSDADYAQWLSEVEEQL